MDGSGRERPTTRPPQPCARLYYCLTAVSTRCKRRRVRAPHRTIGTELPKNMSASSRVRIGKVSVDRMSLADMLQFVRESLRSRRARTVFYANSYAMTLAKADPEFARVMNKADAVFCDGFGVYFASRVLGGSVPERYAWPDWIDRLGVVCRDDNASMFFLGARQGVAAEAALR